MSQRIESKQSNISFNSLNEKEIKELKKSLKRTEDLIDIRAEIKSLKRDIK